MPALGPRRRDPQEARSKTIETPGKLALCARTVPGVLLFSFLASPVDLCCSCGNPHRHFPSAPRHVEGQAPEYKASKQAVCRNREGRLQVSGRFVTGQLQMRKCRCPVAILPCNTTSRISPDFATWLAKFAEITMLVSPNYLYITNNG